MELDNNIQISSEYLQKQHFDAFIAASGFESRGSYLLGKINTSEIPNKVVLAYTELTSTLFRQYNDDRFKELGFTFYPVPPKDITSLKPLLDQICAKNKKETLDILIDYSCMTKIWYNGILAYFSDLEESYTKVNLWFCYSPSEYVKGSSNVSNKFFDNEVPSSTGNKPIGLLLGLGYESGRSEELARKLKAQVTFAFYADPAYDERYVKEVLENNQALFKMISRDKIIKYPIFDLNSINDTLTQLCIKLRLTHQLVLAPIGPKPFTLMCFVLATRYPDIKIWKVATAGNIAATDRKPHGELLLSKVTFTSEEVDY
jgi:hypothetical protein